jgi:hypothetical protein
LPQHLTPNAPLQSAHGNPQAALDQSISILRLHLADRSQLAKVVYVAEKWPNSRLPATPRRRKRKKSGDAL